MQKHHVLFTAASLTVGTLLCAPSYAQDRGETAGQKVDRAADRTGDALERGVDKTADAAQRAGDKATDKVGDIDVRTEKPAATPGQLPPGLQKSAKDDSEDIRDMLASVTEAAVTNGGFDDLVERFVDADRNRLNTFANQDKDKFATLNGRIDQIRKDWKAKYNQDFDLNEEVVFGNQFANFQVVQGEIVNPALLSNWPVPQKMGDQLKSDAARSEPPKADGAKPGDMKPGDRNLEKGRNVAILHFPASHGMPEVAASLIHELPDNWKIDVPDNVSGQQLHDQLLAHLTMFGEMKDQWPADVNEAYRMAVHHVLGAVYNVSAQHQAK